MDIKEAIEGYQKNLLAERMVTARLCDWPDDFPHENGNYNCKCSTCQRWFIGHKRRVTCRECAQHKEC